MDKQLLESDANLLASVYSEQRARHFHRYNKPMSIGHVACSLSHRMVYEDMVKRQVKRALIFEDDVVPQFDALHHIPQVLAELPSDWDTIYFGYDKNGASTSGATIKQFFYHALHALGMLKWNHSMVKNLFARPYSAHLHKAGYHDLLHSYGMSLKAAQTMIQLQTPIAFNADPAVAWAVSNGMLNAFITEPQIFMQEVQLNPDTYVSLIKENDSAALAPEG
jgi:glycosyl transferase family 25